MNINLKDLGLDKKELRALVVEKLVEQVMDEEGAQADFASQLQTSYAAEIKKAVEKLAEEKVLPRVTEIIETTTFKESNRWGEPVEKGKTLKEHLNHIAEKWVTEEVNYNGKTRGQDSYSWTKSGTRIAYMIHEHLQYSIDTAVKNALSQFNSQLSIGLQETVKIKLDEALKNLKINTSIK